MGDFVHTVDAKGITSQFSFVAGQEEAFWLRARRNHLLADWFSEQMREVADRCWTQAVLERQHR